MKREEIREQILGDGGSVLPLAGWDTAAWGLINLDEQAQRINSSTRPVAKSAAFLWPYGDGNRYGGPGVPVGS